MFSIAARQITPAMLSLFDLSKPTILRAFSVLEGVTQGQIFVDSFVHPTRAVVRDGMYGTLYFGGQVDPDGVRSMVRQFQQTGEVGIGCWLDDPLNEMIPPSPEYDGSTLYFTERLRSNREKPRIPEGYQLAIRDESLVKQSFDYESTVAAFSTEENVLRYTLGVVILQEGKVVCEAATGAPTHGQIEVGVTTHELHRERALATCACAHLIEMCEAKGYATWWDCAKQNTASTRLAHKLGYHNAKEYRYVWWSGRTGSA